MIDDDDPDDVYHADVRPGRKGVKDEYEESDDDEILPEKKSSTRGKKGTRSAAADVVMDDLDDDDFDPPPPKKQANGHSKPTPKRKAKSAVVDDDSEDQGTPAKKPAKKRANAAKQASPAKKRTPKEKPPPVEDSAEIKDILGSIPTVRAPTPPQRDGEPGKFDFRAQASRAEPNPASGTKEIPIGAEDCLAGLTFVFTGLLDTLGREQGQELVKRYGGSVTTSPSSRTSFVVLGNDAGPKKLVTIHKLNIKTIDEDGLFELIRRLPAHGGGGKAAAKSAEKREKEAQKVKEMAAEMEREERRLGGAGRAGTGAAGKTPAGNGTTSGPAIDNRLWTTKYAPTTMSQICGNKGQVEKLQRWLREWPTNQRIGFKKAGKDGSFNFRAVIIHGPPGIGKTTAAHIVARAEGYDVLESNASDTRSKKLVETGLRGILDNTSLLGYFAGDDKKVEAGKKKLVLVMDEVDGMSAGDRGGVGALAQVCRKTNIPIDPHLQRPGARPR